MIDYSSDFECGEVFCDECGCSSESINGSFQDVINEIKSLGWKVVKFDNCWEHYCFDCARDLEE